MLPYWLLFILFAGGVIQSRRSRATLTQSGQLVLSMPPSPLLIACAILPIAMIGFRYQVGADWVPYELIYSTIGYLSFSQALNYTDPGYGFINWLAHAMGAEIWLVNLTCGVIFTVGLVRFANAQPNPWLAVVVAIPYLVIGVAMGYSRQAVAIGLAMIGLTALAKGSAIRFVLWVLAAALFHRTAIIVLAIVGVAYSRNKLQALLLSAVAAAAAYFLLVRQVVEQYTVGYVENVYEAQGAGIRLAMNVVPAIVFLLYRRRFSLNSTELAVWTNFSVVALAFVVGYFAVASSVIIDRLALYVIPLQLFVLSRVPYAFGQRGSANGTLLIVIVLYCAVVQFVWLNFANHAQYWLPYQFYPLF
jgi:hypothetical protein